MAQFERRRCVGQDRLTQVTILAILRDTGSPQEEFFNSMSLDEWEIRSFNPKSRIVCINIINTNMLINMTVPDLKGNLSLGF